jgi:CRP/FNR family transcriptional regulator, cyclic AMP receptor protein
MHTPTAVTSALAGSGRTRGQAGPPRGMSRRWVEALQAVPLFAGVSERHLRKLVRSAEEVRVPAGSPVIFREDTGREFFVILDGTAVVGPPTGRRVVIGPGAFFGEMSVIDGQPRSASVRAETDMTLMVLGRPAFLRLLKEESSVALAVITELAARVRKLEGATPRS